MVDIDTSEKQFEADIETYLLSTEGGYTRGDDTYDREKALYRNTLFTFIKTTQQREWEWFEKQNPANTEDTFIKVMDDAIGRAGLLHVLRHGFKTKGRTFRLAYFKPESTLNQTTAYQYSQNIVHVYRQWYYSPKLDPRNSVDMVLVLNGIPVFALELKNQFKGQTVKNSMRQWREDRNPLEPCFGFNRRILAYLAVDLENARITTKLDGDKTRFLPFDQGSNGAGNDGEDGNPTNGKGYPTSHIWETVFQKDSMLDIIQKFLHLQTKTITKKNQASSRTPEYTTTTKQLIFPRYHQLHVVRKLINNVLENGSGHNYLIQHSAGSGKSNSIAWTAYRLASLHDKDNNPIYSSVIIVTDRTVLDAQLQETISSFDHTLGTVTTIDHRKNSKDLRDAINNGDKIIVTTLQKFPVIYDQIEKPNNKNYAIIVDEAHSSQTGQSSIKLKSSLANLEEAIKEYAYLMGLEPEEVDPTDKLVRDLLIHGRHKNLSYFAFTATPKDKTLELFGTQHEDGSFHPFHIYSMKQAIKEGFIEDVLKYYTTYNTSFKIAKTIPDNPELPSSRTTKLLKQYQQLHPYNIAQKSQIIIETFRETTANKIGGKAKMMVVTPSRLAAIKYFEETKRYCKENGYTAIKIMVAFSGTVTIDDIEYSESKLNIRDDGTHISESQTKNEFHENFNILIVAKKFLTGFDEPLLHTMIVDDKLKGVAAVQTLSRLNRKYPRKEDTYILDFVNEKEDIIKAFQPFYQETTLKEEINVDLLYQAEHELRGYFIYNNFDIEKLSDIIFENNPQPNQIGRIMSSLHTSINRYAVLDDEKKYQFRRLLRTFITWYDYISHIQRIFDADIHKEYTFLTFLRHAIPKPNTEIVDLEGKLKLEYYKLKKTFEGSLTLQEENGVYTSATKKGGAGLEKKEPLDEILARFNERYKGDFGDEDKVFIQLAHAKLLQNKNLQIEAKAKDLQMFNENIFPEKFEEVAIEYYSTSNKDAKTIFHDTRKYNLIMQMLGKLIYQELRERK